MANWTDEDGRKFWSLLDPALWSATRQSFAARINECVKFLKCVKADFLRGASDIQVRQETGGGFLIEVAGSTPNGSEGFYRILADRDQYGGTQIAGGFLNRYITVMGSVIFLETPSNALPGGSDEGLLKSNLLGSDSGDGKPIFGTWYTSGGIVRPASGSSPRVFQKSGTYADGAYHYDLALFAGADGSEDDGRLMLFENAPHGAAFHLILIVGPQCETE